MKSVSHSLRAHVLARLHTPSRTLARLLAIAPMALLGAWGTGVHAAPQAPTAATSFAACPQFFPATPPVVAQPAQQRALCFNEFAVLHSGQTKTPIYVAQRLSARQLLAAQGLKRKDKFYAEGRLPQAERADLDDYKRSGYSRGHMAPTGEMATPEGKAQSFSLANMVPQDIQHNGGAWNDIEKDTRAYIRRAAGDVYVITGPIYSGPVRSIGDGKVRVPDAIFKLVYDPATQRSWVHWQNNRSGERAGPPISYAEFVKRTGLKFLP